MGSALYVELKNEPDGLSTLMNGKPLAKAWEALDAVAAEIGVPPITKLCTPNWRNPETAVPVFQRYLAHVTAAPECVPDPAGVIADLQSVLRLVGEAERLKTKWRLSVDY